MKIVYKDIKDGFNCDIVEDDGRTVEVLISREVASVLEIILPTVTQTREDEFREFMKRFDPAKLIVDLRKKYGRITKVDIDSEQCIINDDNDLVIQTDVLEKYKVNENSLDVLK